MKTLSALFLSTALAAGVSAQIEVETQSIGTGASRATDGANLVAFTWVGMGLQGSVATGGGITAGFGLPGQIATPANPPSALEASELLIELESFDELPLRERAASDRNQDGLFDVADVVTAVNED